MLLAFRCSSRMRLFLGTFLGFFLVDGAAILAGSWLTHFVPAFWIKIAAGSLFLIFGIVILKKSAEPETSEEKTGDAFWLGFAAIFFAEWGDKTQIAAGLFATRYPWPAVFAGTLTALGTVSLMAIYAGKFLSKYIRPKLLQKIAGILFLLVGLSILIF
jgi:putative Ca2+/H+ antiporter (TMEM165/GDT1 family)